MMRMQMKLPLRRHRVERESRLDVAAALALHANLVALAHVVDASTFAEAARSGSDAAIVYKPLSLRAARSRRALFRTHVGHGHTRSRGTPISGIPHQFS